MRFVILALFALGMFSSIAVAQDCTIGLYGDPAGTIPHGMPQGDPPRLNLYVVIFAEDLVAAAAYRIDWSGFEARGLYLINRWYGPDGTGLGFDEPTGTNVAIRECVVGFGERPILITEYEFIHFFWVEGPATITVEVEANASQHPDYPQYVNCVDTKRDCFAAPPFTLYFPVVPTDARSFGKVKSLYHKD